MTRSRRAMRKRFSFTRRGCKLTMLALLVGCSGYLGGGDGTGEGAGANGQGGPNGNGTDGTNGTLGGIMECWYSEQSGKLPAVTIEHVFELQDGVSQLHVRLTFALAFNDNTYGVNSIGWGKRGHTFKDLERSDHAEMILTDGGGATKLQFKMDYVTADPSAPSGFASLGVFGGDGQMIVGDPAHILDYMTSLDRNLNELGYSKYIVDSPPTDEDYTPSQEAPKWDYRVSFDAWIDELAFGPEGFGEIVLEYVHASPSKTSDDTWLLYKDDCPPGWIPGGNDTGAGGGPGSGGSGATSGSGSTGSGSTGTDSGAGGYDSGSSGTDSGAGGYDSGSSGTDSGAGGYTTSGSTSGSGASNDSGAGGYNSGSGGFVIPTGSSGTDSGAGGSTTSGSTSGSTTGSTSGSGGSNDSGAGGSTGTDTGAGGGCGNASCTVNADCPEYFACYAGCCYAIPN